MPLSEMISNLTGFEKSLFFGCVVWCFQSLHAKVMGAEICGLNV